jgi:ABC-2 type transport system ATP-binding protein
MPSPAISIERLSKRYPKSTEYALRDLSLSVQPGEVYGFLGANGAGKSTTIRLLLNFIQPSSGTARIMDDDIVTDRVNAKRHIGYLSGEITLYSKVTGRQFFDFLTRLQPLKHADYLDSLIKRFDVEVDKPLETLSKGNRQKIGLVQAFMHEPDVLILDEPTSGLDPLMQEEFFTLLKEAKQRGVATFFSSHNLAEAQRVCDRVGIIKHGKLIHEQAIDRSSSLSKPIFRITVSKAADLKRLIKDPHLHFVSQADSMTVLMQPKAILSQSLAAVSVYDLTSFISQVPDLENEFMEFYGDGS